MSPHHSPSNTAYKRSRSSQWWHAIRAHQPSESSWASALRRGLLVAALVAIGAITGEFATASIIAIGALNMGLVDAVVPRRTLARTLIAVAVLGGIVAFLAASVAGTWWTVPLLAVLAYVTGAIGSLGLVAFNTTFMTLVMAVLFTNDPGDVDNSLRLGVLVLIGGLLQAGSSIIAWRRERDAKLLNKLSLTLAALTDLAMSTGTRSNDGDSSPDDLLAVARLDAAAKEAAAERAISDAGLNPAREQQLGKVVSEVNWTRLCLTTWLASGERTQEQREKVQTMLADADWFLHRHPRTPAPIRTATDELDVQPISTTADAHPTWTTLVNQLNKLQQATRALGAAAKSDATDAGTLADARASSESAGANSPSPTVLLARIGHLLLPSSPTFRQAARLTLAVTIAQAIAIGFDIERGYWLPLTVVMVVKPDFSTTLIRGSLRIIGTVAAVVLGGAVLEVTGNPQWLMVVLLAIFAPLTMRWISANYAFGAFAITSSVLVLIEAGDPTGTTITLRLENTLIGVAIAIAAYALYPSWSGNRLLPALSKALNTQQVWTAQVLAALVSGQPPQAGQRSAGHDSRDALLAARPLVDQANLEPHRGAIDPGAAFSLLDACHRAAVATLTLEVAARGPVRLPDHDHLVQTTRRIDDALAQATSIVVGIQDDELGAQRGSTAPAATPEDGPSQSIPADNQSALDADQLSRIDPGMDPDAATVSTVNSVERLVTAANATVLAAQRIQRVP